MIIYDFVVTAKFVLTPLPRFEIVCIHPFIAQHNNFFCVFSVLVPVEVLCINRTGRECPYSADYLCRALRAQLDQIRDDYDTSFGASLEEEFSEFDTSFGTSLEKEFDEFDTSFGTSIEQELDKFDTSFGTTIEKEFDESDTSFGASIEKEFDEFDSSFGASLEK